MKKGFSTVLFVSLFTQALYAGSMGVVKTGHDWSGFYVGGNIGAVWNDFSGHVTVPSYVVDGVVYPASPMPYSTNKSTAIGGGQLGYNWQKNHLVLGTEISIEGMSLNGSHTVTVSEFNNPVFNPGVGFITGDNFSSEINWQAGWVGRLGIGIQSWLFYALGGVDFTEAKFGANIIATVYNGQYFPPSSGSTRATLTGGTLGVGTEYALTPTLHLGLEYRYSDYGHYNYYAGLVAEGLTTSGSYIYAPIVANMNLSTNQVVAKFNYQFSG
jgi:outer membrane immunogenic protein